MNDMWSRGPRARRWLLVVEVISVLTVAVLSLLVTGRGYSSWWSTIAVLVLVVAFFLRRRTLRWSFGLAALAGALQLIDAHGFLFFADLLYGPICARFGASPDRRTRRVGLVAAILACIVPGVLVMPRWLTPQPDPPSLPALIGVSLMFAGFAALVSVGGWTWGYLRLQQRLQVEAAVAVQLSDAERRRLEQVSAQSAFREQIAAEMHDVVGHSWAVVAAQADGARYAMRTSPDAAERALETIADVARSSITELREILRQLRYSEGVEGQVSADQQAALLARMRGAGMTLDFDETGSSAASQTIRLAAYRILTECLTNALKHGDLRHPVHASLTWDGGFVLRATNRIRVPHTNHRAADGLGLAGMRERARSLGGDIHVDQNGGTWTLDVCVPIPQDVLDETGEASDAATNRPSPPPTSPSSGLHTGPNPDTVKEPS